MLSSNMPVLQPKLLRRTAPPEQTTALPPNLAERLLTTRQVAAILNLKVDTLKKSRARGKGPAFLKLDTGAIRYRLEAVQKYLSDSALINEIGQAFEIFGGV